MDLTLMYRLVDRQGTGAKKDNKYRSMLEITQDLISYHSPDVPKAELMKLEDLAEIGDWAIRRVFICPDTGLPVVQEWQGGQEWLCLHNENDPEADAREVEEFIK